MVSNTNQGPGPDSTHLAEQAAAALAAGDGAGAAALYEQILLADPHHIEALANLGALLSRLGQHARAQSLLGQANQLLPGQPGILINLANAAIRAGDPMAAIGPFRQALALAPDLFQARIGLSAALRDGGELAAALAEADLLAAQMPQLAEAHNLRGLALIEMGATGDALNALSHAASLDPANPQIRFNLALARLAQGDLAQGWADFEARLAVDGRAAARESDLATPRWQGQALPGQHLFIWREQGIGDELLLQSVLPDAIAAAGPHAKVTIDTDPRMVSLLARSLPGAQIIPAGPNVPAHDVQIPLGSLPALFRKSLADFPSRPGYLTPDPNRIAGARDFLASLGPGPYVGLAWRSGLLTGIRRQFFPALDDLAPLFAGPPVTWVLLQYDRPEDEIAALEKAHGIRIHAQPGLNLRDDFDGVAALMAALDSIISAGTTVAALAGAVGAPCLTFGVQNDYLNLGTDHRPWQPSEICFRKAHQAAWRPLMEQVAAALHARHRRA